ncbi:MAG: hypothetical protein KJ720_06380 [Proteobacteria bacterium]|nr:hypothetical protein [Pseudomonadota bacterium]MBU1451155.1 hypothetical protein [Pseudomonadota bacterium]MBU2467372.1 hypothetical protein [Pseudomonadota bacterium]MBU2517052.1 hypothetical protein [Pseudomonadota bacterium]
MPQTEVVQGKKVALMVSAQDAPMLRERGNDFFKALRGKTIKPNDQVLFDEVLLWVEATKPKGVVRIGDNTKVKISISKKELRPSCPSCSQEQQQGEMVCSNCGTDLPVVTV